jgi:Ni,Fe-hydrogenase III small subunit
VRIATTSLAGCFGCHTSFLDIDERIFELVKIAEFDPSPFTDIKHCCPCDIALIEGGVCNAENVQALRELRANAKILVAIGACGITGGSPAVNGAYRQNVRPYRMVKKDRPTSPPSRDRVANALDRWDEEGGAPAVPWPLPYEPGDLLEAERRVLECLGAALVIEWNGLPTDVQRRLFEHATSGKSHDAALLKARIARFLHDHKDDRDSR